MRLIFASALLSVLALAGDQAGLVILYDVDNAYSSGAFADMRSELAGIMQKTGLEIDWHAKPSDSFPPTAAQIVIIRFRGHCTMDGLMTTHDHDSGALAVTHIVNGEVLPFSDVNCDLVRANVRAAMLGFDRQRADLFRGRALGRVVAHELWHILSKSTSHGRHGVTKKCLSPQQLVADRIEVLEEDLQRLVDAGSDAHGDPSAHIGNSGSQF